MSLIALLLAAAAPQTAPPPPPKPPKVDCSDADHRALDFWIGDWDVYAAGSDYAVAHSRIERIVGCAISETFDQFTGPGGKPIDYHGRSISAYVPAGSMGAGGLAAILCRQRWRGGDAGRRHLRWCDDPVVAQWPRRQPYGLETFEEWRGQPAR